VPQSQPQWLALLSRADELYYGGAAGGGKSDLLIGLASCCAQHSVIFRRVYPNLKEIIRRTREIVRGTADENKSDKTWTYPEGNTIEFGAVQREENKHDWQGRPHDHKLFDEIPEFTKTQYEFICGWTRTTDTGQRVRVVVTGNPPMDESGSWVVERWAAWLDKKHPHPAKQGELRWYAVIEGDEQEFPNGEPILHKGETVYPRSRTFIKALLSDNPYYSKDSRYISILQSLPEPMRSQLLYGDYDAATVPDPWQVIPTEWVRAAQRRWLERTKPDVPLTAAGIDPARGGRDNMSMSKRYDNWFDELDFWPGVMVVDGPTGAELVHQALGDEKPGAMNVDIGGVGTSPFDSLKVMYPNVVPINAAGGSEYRDKSKLLKMRNMRAEYYWRMRDALDPVSGDDLALPPGNEIVADLCSARYSVSAAGVLIEEKDEIKKRLGRSPDKGESILLANYAGGVNGWMAWAKEQAEGAKQ
jgi:hypothetical protein